ncbi:hypothetical protein SAMN06297144_0450 [Sphingomonas guangdongensis]|uniref:4-amino-4-deoxy-L-arabinose transferase n=1 Tax=Sphingomonas guangdongensis TaxID=1141890 RepID=A0A285QBC5_9SPHN|nr:DUF6311 domain-containing protein [Sphingomonas guangdongensis]SOB79245.1 hypothetical protein SAMN06297144_0450 [Sphingomonas guangdongensis]
MRRALAPLACLLGGLLLFLLVFPAGALRIDNPGWLIRGSDNGENALGLHAWLHDEAASLRPHTTLLNAPEGVPLLFTDSNPLVALLAAPAARLLPADAQLVGPWILLCFVLQLAFAYLLLRPHAPGRLALVMGTLLLAALPTLFNRFIHANLLAHWLILAALWLFVDPRRAGRHAAWAALLAITVLVHSYLLVMVAAIWGSAMLERFVATLRERGRLIAAAAASLALVAAIALWLGAGGAFQSTGSYGAFALPLDALWNPGNPAYSTLLPATPQREARGFEGFQYLGAGLLLLLPVALGLALRGPAPAATDRLVLARLRWLLPALAVLTLVAVSNFPDVAGTRLPRFPLPDALAPVLDSMRASGRLFWPAAYTLVFAALLLAFRLPARRSGLLLAVLLGIQALDLSNMWATIRLANAEAATTRLYARTRDPRWDLVITRARDISFVPADVTRDLALFQEVAWRAAKSGKPVRTVYAARVGKATAERHTREAADFAAGRLVPGRLYVLIDGAVAPAGVRTLVLDRVRLVQR